MSARRRTFVFGAVGVVGLALALPACRETVRRSGGPSSSALAALWNAGTPAFGVFVPNERPPTPDARRRGERPAAVYTVAGGRRLAANPLLDFVFLNLEGAYDVGAVRAIAEGLGRSDTVGGVTLLVRIPPIEEAGEDTTRARVREVLSLGAGGVVFPHVRTPTQARAAIRFVAETGADIWSPDNPDGSVIAMIMVEDPDAVALAAEFAGIPGYSVLACGIGSLTRALSGDREAAEAGNLQVLAEARRAGLADMITADLESIEERIRDGFLGLLMQGPTAEEAIRAGRAVSGRGE